MASNSGHVYQLRIDLKGIRPPIWRRVLVPADITLDRLHLVVQAAMDWANYHLHEFEVGGKRYGPPENEEYSPFPVTGVRERLAEMFGVDPTALDDFNLGPPPFVDEASVTLREVAPKEGVKIDYEYDFGDSWEHTIEVEKIIPAEPGVEYPVCVKGKRACPPEDCGGVWGYMEMLEVIANPKHPDHRDRLEWLGRKFDPEEFDLEACNRRLRNLDQYARDFSEFDDDDFDDDDDELDELDELGLNIFYGDPQAMEDISPEQVLESYRALLSALVDRLEAVEELPDGYALRLEGHPTSWMAAAHFIMLEYINDSSQKFVLELGPDEGPIWLRITGPKRIKNRVKKLFGLK